MFAMKKRSAMLQ